nr:hypothetical protein [Tanacetum cinerariifolium]
MENGNPPRTLGDYSLPSHEGYRRYVWGLREKVTASVTSSTPSNLYEAINMARELVDLAIKAKATRITESNKRKWEDQQRNDNNRNNNTHHH